MISGLRSSGRSASQAVTNAASDAAAKDKDKKATPENNVPPKRRFRIIDDPDIFKRHTGLFDVI